MDEKQILNEIIITLQDGGYSPYEQLMGYIEVGNVNYITRKNGAREKIKLVSRELIKQEIEKHIGEIK